MSRASSVVVASFAVALAFGVGYAVRLAVAWAGDGVRVVEVETPSSVRRGAAPAPVRRPDAAPSPDAEKPAAAASPGDAAAPAPSVPAAASADDAFGKAMYEVHARFGRVGDFRRAVDRVAEAPLGRSPEGLGLLDAAPGSPVAAPLVEGIVPMRARLSAVNAGASRLPPEGNFQLAAFRRGGRFEVAVGDSGLPTKLDVTFTAAYFAGESGKAPAGSSPSDEPFAGAELTQAQSDALVRMCGDAHRDEEAARRAFWTRLRRLVADGRAAPLDPRQVAAVCVADGRCAVIRVGDDPELDRLLDEADRAERAVRADVEFALRR